MLLDDVDSLGGVEAEAGKRWMGRCEETRPPVLGSDRFRERRRSCRVAEGLVICSKQPEALWISIGLRAAAARVRREDPSGALECLSDGSGPATCRCRHNDDGNCRPERALSYDLTSTLERSHSSEANPVRCHPVVVEDVITSARGRRTVKGQTQQDTCLPRLASWFICGPASSMKRTGGHDHALQPRLPENWGT